MGAEDLPLKAIRAFPSTSGDEVMRVDRGPRVPGCEGPRRSEIFPPPGPDLHRCHQAGVSTRRGR